MAFSFDLAVIVQRERRATERRSKVIIKRRRTGICKSHEASQEIPFELVIEILTRLPAKSLMRFKSVSKTLVILHSFPILHQPFHKCSFIAATSILVAWRLRKKCITIIVGFC
ncbi:unnamed protein product [Microthlaspi erraticum]|uniref:F-box domain-containing protein n=1 Tax=Microthlaspi erraticum TaxID=1685480 RepID=A0A6D2I707_9BRAS|nr:unnamed protein product [Microthlaspi erraticum]CAA7057223.1 unnamed protein product [Microthlaspi erraticum]